MADAKRNGKGKNFSSQEEQQLCRTFLNISEDPMIGTGQKAKTFWERIGIHYNFNRPRGCDNRSERSLETKWHEIKADVAKFSGVHASVIALHESGTSEDDGLTKAHELYKCKHPKNASFKYTHCWEILKDVPKWATYRDAEKSSPTLKRKLLEENSSSHTNGAASVIDIHEVEEKMSDYFVLPDRPKGKKAAKEEAKLSSQNESARKAQAKATADMAAANFEKASIMRDQAALALFSIPEEDIQTDAFREYVYLRRQEELDKLKLRLHKAKKLQGGETIIKEAPVFLTVIADGIEDTSLASVPLRSLVALMEDVEENGVATDENVEISQDLLY